MGGYLKTPCAEHAAHLAAQAEWPSDEDVRKACAAHDKALRDIGYNDELDDGMCYASPLLMRAALKSVRPPAVPMEGHTISVKSCDGEWEGEARWEYQESAYVTQEAVRPAKEKATNYVSGHADSTGKFHATAQEKAEPYGYRYGNTLYESSNPLTDDHIRNHGLALYTAPPAEHVVPDAHGLSLELQGVIADVEQGHGFDDVCLRTIKRVEEALSAAPEATPSPTIDVAAVREVIAECRRPMPRISGKVDYYDGYDEAMSDVADQLEKIIGDAK
jgi:hypothetical protein